MDNNQSPTPPEQNPVQDTTEPIPPQPAVQSPLPQVQATGTSNMTTAIVLGLLVFFYPLGLILIWTLTKWPLWVKILLSSLIVILAVLGIIGAIALSTLNPAKQFAQANDLKRSN